MIRSNTQQNVRKDRYAEIKAINRISWKVTILNWNSDGTGRKRHKWKEQ